MFGRVRRAAGSRVAAVLRTYSPEAVASTMAIGMGTAAVTSAGAAGRSSGGRTVSPVAEAVSGVLDWGRSQQRGFLRLPARVLAVVDDDECVLSEWTFAKARGRVVCVLRAGTFEADAVHYVGQTGVRITVDSGKLAILTGPRRMHPRVRRTIAAIVELATEPTV